MITILYLVLLISFLILEKIVSEKEQHRGILFALGVAVLGILLSTKFIWLALILVCVNVGRFIIQELQLMKLTSLKDRLANVMEFQTRFL
ncbi:MAG TPA: hypothetical protein GXZ76_01115 [Clostridiaceae bacterium]|jgi:uncharacterized membrane protein (DUF485 family)|nr:hypothetical protein [Clostridiaceae bacterium]